MAQIAGELHAVLQEAKQHPGVQLEANSFPALPVDTASYIAYWGGPLGSLLSVQCMRQCPLVEPGSCWLPVAHRGAEGGAPLGRHFQDMRELQPFSSWTATMMCARLSSTSPTTQRATFSRPLWSLSSPLSHPLQPTWVLLVEPSRKWPPSGRPQWTLLGPALLVNGEIIHFKTAVMSK